MKPDPTSLDRLHDIIVPVPVPWWPPAPGWYWVLGALAVFVVAGGLRATLWWQRNRYRREALAEWRQQQAQLDDDTQRIPALASMAELLKRTALTAFPREQVASLTGSKWLAFLDRTGLTTGFSSETGKLLESVAYDPRGTTLLDASRARETASLVRQWIEHHRVGGATAC